LQESTKANPYVYADNDPINKVDPSGKSATIPCWLQDVVGGIGVAQGIVDLITFLTPSSIIALAPLALITPLGLGLFVGLAISESVLAIVLGAIAIAQCKD
jgi:hypothetical protein